MLHATAAGSLAIAMPAPWGAAAGILILLLGVATAWRRALLNGNTAARALVVNAEGGLMLRYADGRLQPARASGGIGVTRWWVALRPRSGGGEAFLVPAGMLPPARHRLLRLWALWGKLPESAAGPQYAPAAPPLS